jgi:hypothetical protein
VRIRALGVCLILAVFPVSSLAQSNRGTQTADPVAGTWELNLAKSKIVPGPAPKRVTRVYAVSGDQITLTTNLIGADGKPITTRSSYAYDGKDYAVTGTPDYDTQAVKLVERGSVTAELKKAGKVVQRVSRKVSPDGKMLTMVFKGTNAKGQTVDSVEIYDRQ